MKLKKIKIKNIRSYQNQEIEFPEGSTLLAGDIGSGKTSILLAIEYAFFGLQPGQRGSSLLANSSDYGEISLELEIDGKNVIIERGLKRGSKTVSQDYASITIDGVRIESSVTEIKSKIIELLNYPQEFLKKTNLLYRYTVYCPQEEMKQIILEDPESRLDILRHIFGIDKYKKIKENLLLITSKLREKSRTTQAEIITLEEDKSSIVSYQKFVEQLNSRLHERNVHLADKISERKEAEKNLEIIREKITEKEKFSKEIDKTAIMLANKKEKLAETDKERGEFENKISLLNFSFNENEYLNVKKELNEKKLLVERINKKCIETSAQIIHARKKIQEDLAKKERIFKIDICPTCLQDVQESYKHNILNATEKSISFSNQEIASLNDSLQDFQNNLNKEKQNLARIESRKTEIEINKIKLEEISSAKEKLHQLERVKHSLSGDIEFLVKHIELLKSSVLEFSKFDNIYRVKEHDLKKLFQEEKLIEIEIAEIKKEIELTEKDIQKIKLRILELEKKKENLMHTIELEQWLSSDFLNLISFTEKNIMLQLRKEFSSLFNKWFSMLTTDAFYVHLDENFTPIILQGDFELDYAYLSGGERTAVALAYRLALNQIINSMLSRIKTRDLVILDEPTDGFSDQQLDKVRDILQEMNVAQLIIVSHENKIEGFVDNIIRLKKESGISNVHQKT